MNKYLALGFLAFTLTSCNKIEEKINETIDTTTESVKQKAKDAVKKTIDSTISESLNSLTKAENAMFTDVFPDANMSLMTDFKGKKVKFPNGSPAYFFKYKGDKDAIITMLEAQPTTNEAKSDKTVKKIDGQSIIDKIALIEKFLPANTIDTSFLQDIKTDNSIEFYKLKRIPNVSTIIYNPKKNEFLQFVETSK